MELKMFGKTLRIEREDGWGITLKAPTQKEAAKLAPQYNDPIVGYTIPIHRALTSKDEEEWWDKTRKSDGDVAWGIYPDEVSEGKAKLKSKLVGFTSLHFGDFNGRTLYSGIIIADQAFWGRGIAGLAHIGRTWYAANLLDAETILSYVLGGSEEVSYKGSFARWKKTKELKEGNWPSRKALERVGYTYLCDFPAHMKPLRHRHATWQLQWIHPEKTSLVFPEGLPKKYEKGVTLAQETLERAKTMIKNI